MTQKPHFLNQLIKDIVNIKMFTTKLRKDLGLLEVFCISSGAMISSGLFVLISLAFSKTGPAVIFSYTIASLLALSTILAKSELVTAMPKTGGIFVFTDHSMGPLMGTLSGLAAWTSLAFKTAFALLGIGIFASILYPDISEWQIKLFAVGACLFFTVVNIIGVKFTGRFQSLMVIVLLIILVLYIGVGVFFIKFSRYTPFAPQGLFSILSTAGLVFVSYSGTTKIASVAGEVRNPDRNLPLGMLLSWGVVSLIYLAVIYVTVGILDPQILQTSLTPLSFGGQVIMGEAGLVILSLAAILAFVTTGNAGILAASRNPMAMSKVGLLPHSFEKVSKRGVPWISILVTSAIMISIILFLELEVFVKTASTLKLILFIFANLSLIFMRHSHLEHYQPTFRSPFVPWLPLLGIVGYIVLIIDMGQLPLVLAGAFFAAGTAWYFLFAYFQVKKEYALLKVIKNTAFINASEYILDEELRELLVERDLPAERRFKQKVSDSAVLDIEEKIHPKEIYQKAAEVLSPIAQVSVNELYNQIVKRERKGHIIGRDNFALIFAPVKGRGKLKIALIRTQRALRYSARFPAVRAFIFIIASPDIRNFYLRSLMWLTQIAENKDFLNNWRAAENAEALRQVLLSFWKK
ncbi:MAG: amino acid permease [Candidatus Margulisbacteria bacterium]|nr:amino acid permease [Candidatus Margulisiibacteriota bacterium]